MNQRRNPESLQFIAKPEIVFCSVSRGCLEGVLRISVEGVWRVSGGCLEGVWKVSIRCLDGVWKVISRKVVRRGSRRCLEGV